MIAVDSSSFIAFLSGDEGDDVDAVAIALAQKQAVLPPVALSELLSDPKLPQAVATLLKQLPLLPLTEGFWERVGSMRSRILKSGRKARLADALIAQSCLDHDVALVTRDDDFRHFAQAGKLKIL
ncbi:MAG TPA: PIN domain-containing protein [bacterium]|nr:PIN domain-containing protein [bacterium]